MTSEVHSRLDEDHRSVCEDCYSDWLDHMQEMTIEAEIDEMIANEELAQEIEVA